MPDLTEDMRAVLVDLQRQLAHAESALVSATHERDMARNTLENLGNWLEVRRAECRDDARGNGQNDALRRTQEKLASLVRGLGLTPLANALRVQSARDPEQCRAMLLAQLLAPGRPEEGSP